MGSCMNGGEGRLAQSGESHCSPGLFVADAHARLSSHRKRRFGVPPAKKSTRLQDSTAHRLLFLRAVAALPSVVWRASRSDSRQTRAGCGYDDMRAIEPDHQLDAVKAGNLSRMVQMCASEERIRSELDKCVPRCVRCHRRVTQQRRPCAWRSAERLPPSWQRRLDQQDQNDKLKMILGCLDCRWREWPRGLDWDHVACEKVTDIARMIANGLLWSEISAEIAKCDCVCANCHRSGQLNACTRVKRRRLRR